MGIIFPGSPEPTVGVEIELQTVDPTTMALVSEAPGILNQHLDDLHIKRELMQCCLEVSTRVCQDVSEVDSDLRKHIGKIIEAGDRSGLGIISSGTHPFSHWADQAVSKDTRYDQQLHRTQWTARRLLTFGLHVHVGVSTPEKAMAVFNAMSLHIPYLLALSASSPFWEGLDSGLQSSRSKVFESLPGGGLPFRMRNWREFQQMVRILQKVGAINSVQEMWGDLRPHSKYGTLEVRVCDAMPSLQELLAVTALVQALVVWLGDLYERGTFMAMPRPWILQENKWRAARWGMDCRLVTDDSGQQHHFRTLMEDLLENVYLVSESLRSWKYLKHIESILETGGSAARQRKVWRETNSLEEVARSLEQELRGSTTGPPTQETPPAAGEKRQPSPFSSTNTRGAVWRDF